MASDYLLTWKPESWPYSELRKLIDVYEAGGEAREPWRFSAHTQVKLNDKVYVFKQGDPPRGIFAVGKVIGGPIQNPKPGVGRAAWSVSIEFACMVDPTEAFLVAEDELLKLPAPEHRWKSRASGVRLESEAARDIDRLVGANSIVQPHEGVNEPFDPYSLEDARERTKQSIILRRGQRKFRFELMAAYESKCAISNCDIKDILEAAHIVPYKGPDTNDITNGLLLRSDLHTLFDCGLISVDPKTMRLSVTDRILKTSYRALKGKKVRLPTDPDMRPNIESLKWHIENVQKIATS